MEELEFSSVVHSNTHYDMLQSKGTGNRLPSVTTVCETEANASAVSRSPRNSRPQGFSGMQQGIRFRSSLVEKRSGRP
jgi:hypothetical protein